jgi:TolA-binding protein
MYWNLRTTLVVCALLLSWCAPTVRADPAEDQYTVAAHHYRAARWEMAIEEFTTFLTSYPDHPRAETVTFFLAESLMQVSRWDDARVRFQQYVQRSPAGKYVRQAEFRLGEASYLAGYRTQARNDLERFRQSYPDDELCAYVWPYLGEIAVALDDAAAAKEAFAEGLKRFPDGPLSGACRFGMARALESLGDAEGATRFYRFLCEQGAVSPLGDDAALQLALLQYDQRQYAAAVETFRALGERFPGSELLPQAQYWLGMSQVALQDFSAAAATLDEALRRFDTHELAAAMTFAAADAHRRAGEPTKAEPLCQRVLQQWPASEWADDSLQTLVQMAWDAGEYERVCALADRFAVEFPDSSLHAVVRQTLARADLKHGRFDAAIQVFESLLRAGATSPSAPSSQEIRPDATAAPRVATAPTTDAANKYYLALAYLGARRHQEALDVLDQLAAMSEPAELVNGARAARASALVELGRFADAVAPLQDYLTSPTLGPDVEQCRAQLAVVLSRLERWTEVEPVVAQLRESHADEELYSSTIEYLAEAAYGKNQNDLAESLFQELANSDRSPQSAARGLSGLAWLKWRQQDGATQSAAAFEQLLLRFPDSPLAAEAAMMRAQILEKLGKPAEALAMYRLVMDRYHESPHVSSAMLSAARIDDASHQDREAEVILRAWLEKFPVSDQRDAAMYQLAWVLIDQGRDDEADKVFSQLRTDFRGSRYWADATYRLAERAARAADPDRADQLAAEILDAEPRGPMTGYALFLRGQLAATAQRWDDVARWMDRLVTDFPNSTLTLPAEYWLAESRYRQKDYEEAGLLFDRLEQATRGRSDAWLAMIPLRRAQVKAHARQWNEASDIAQSIAERFPNFARQHEVDYLLGRYFMNRAEFDEARQAYQRVVASSTGATTETAAMAQWMIGETYFMQKQYNQAIKAYHRVQALYSYAPWQAAALLQAGKCHEVIGQWDEAVKLYLQILKDYPSTRVAEKAALRLRVARQRADMAPRR